MTEASTTVFGCSCALTDSKSPSLGAQVYWELNGGVRCCRPCLEARTISDWRLKVSHWVGARLNGYAASSQPQRCCPVLKLSTRCLGGLEEAGWTQVCMTPGDASELMHTGGRTRSQTSHFCVPNLNPYPNPYPKTCRPFHRRSWAWTVTCCARCRITWRTCTHRLGARGTRSGTLSSQEACACVGVFKCVRVCKLRAFV